MFNVGTPELLVILLVALLVLGPAKLPDAARKMGKALGEVRRMNTGFQQEMRSAMREVAAETDAPAPGTEGPETATNPSLAGPKTSPSVNGRTRRRSRPLQARRTR